MVFKVCFTHYFDENKDKALNIDLDSNNKVVINENNVVVGSISNFKELYYELYNNEENSYEISFYLVSDDLCIMMKLSKSQIYEILEDGLNILDIRL